MNEIEYEIIDELYFVTSFRDIANALYLTNQELCSNLKDLIKRGYVKAFYPNPDTEVEFAEQQFEDNCQQYYFLATKAGLIVHNSR